MVEVGAVGLGFDEPAGAAGVGEAAVLCFGIPFGDEDGFLGFCFPDFHEFWVGGPGVVVVDADDVEVATGGGEEGWDFVGPAVEAGAEDEVVWVVMANRFCDGGEVGVGGVGEEVCAVFVTDLF